MKFSLIICTYKRSKPLRKLLKSISSQSLIPDEILIIDGSPDLETKVLIEDQIDPKVKYYQVSEKDRGLTRQRNYGISKISTDSKVVCFLDDDVVLTAGYFKNLLATYDLLADAVGVGGYILEEVNWKKGSPDFGDYLIEGYKRPLGSRNVLRKRLGLLSEKPPGIMPEFSNGFSIGFLPPTGKTYPVEYFMGGVASYRTSLFSKISFSSYFKGYGLYEDLDFCLRASELGPLYVNTAAQLYHFHVDSGRPNRFKYGMMVIRNGWYVWRVKYPNPNLLNVVKWHTISLMLTIIRLGNVLTTNKKKEAITEGLGRILGWWSLIFKSPKNES